MIAIHSRLASALVGLGLLALTGGQAEAQQARLTKLSDVAFGLLSTTGSDASISQSVCAYATSASGRYSIRASGSGTGGALTLDGTATPLAYEVQWAASPNQTSGTALPANTTVGGFADTTLLSDSCSLVTSSTASLIVTVRAAALSGVLAGSYSGTLTLILAAQ